MLTQEPSDAFGGVVPLRNLAEAARVEIARVVEADGLPALQHRPAQVSEPSLTTLPFNERGDFCDLRRSSFRLHNHGAVWHVHGLPIGATLGSGTSVASVAPSWLGRSLA